MQAIAPVAAHRTGFLRWFTPARWRVIRWLAILAWAVGFGLDCYDRGIHFDRTGQLFWFALGLLAASVGMRRFWYVIVDFAPFAAVLVAYDMLRGTSYRLGMPTWWTPQIDVDKFLFFGHEPTVWLQERLKHANAQWWDVAVCAIYLSFFFLPYITAAVLWLRSREDFYRWAGRFVALSFCGFILFTLIPAAPPWAAAQCTAAQVAHHPNNPPCLRAPAHFVSGGGLLGPMTSVQSGAHDFIERLSFRGFGELHLSVAGVLLKEGQAAVDQVAAVPSLHAGGTVLFALFMWKRVNRAWRVVLAAYPPVMAFCLVYSAEHYVSDILAGWLLALGVHLAANRVERWRASRTSPDSLELSSRPNQESACPPIPSPPETTPSSI